MAANINQVADVTYSDVYESQQEQVREDIDHIDGLEMLRKLMHLLNRLQEIENMLTSGTMGSLKLISEQSEAMVELAKIVQEETIKSADEYRKKIDDNAKKRLKHKIFSVFCALGAVLGAVLTGGATSILMVAAVVGAVISLACAFAPNAINDALSKICGDNKLAMGVLKTLLLASVLVAGSLAGGVGGGVLLTATVFSTLNPMEDLAEGLVQQFSGLTEEEAKEKLESDKGLQIAIAVCDIASGIVGLIASFFCGGGNVAGKLNELKNGAKNAAEEGIELSEMGGSAAARTGSAIAGALESAQTSIKTVEEAAVSLSKLKKLLKLLEPILKQLNEVKLNLLQALKDPMVLRGFAQIFQSASGIGSSAIGIEQAKINMDIGEIRRTLTILDAASTSLETSQGFISGLAKQDEGFMENLQKNYQASSQNFIEKLFIDKVNFAHLLAQSA